jgi:ABC-type uncharacterized transport system substrate-binding protein
MKSRRLIASPKAPGQGVIEMRLARSDPATSRRAARSPTIFICSGDPVADGFVRSLAHPGGNLTGFTVMEPSLGAKLLELLKQIAPDVSRVAMLVNPDSLLSKRMFGSAADAAGEFATGVEEGADSRARRY